MEAGMSQHCEEGSRGSHGPQEGLEVGGLFWSCLSLCLMLSCHSIHLELLFPFIHAGVLVTSTFH
jgi:hypothetical protein